MWLIAKVGPFRSGKSAVLSACAQYRYTLTRKWDWSKRSVTFIMLNPSTADADNDDPTIRRCIRFAKDWECGGVVVVNLFAFRSTSPLELMEAVDPIGPQNDAILQAAAQSPNLTVAGWGVHGEHMRRGAAVRAMFPRLHVLKLTKGGHPGHPLYIPASATPVLWEA